MKLEKNVEFNQFVRPACLAETFMDASEKKFIATGWGLTTHRGQKSNILQKVTLELFTQDECTKSYSQRYSALNRGIIEPQQFCAGSHNESKDTCQVNIQMKYNVTHYLTIIFFSFL